MPRCYMVKKDPSPLGGTPPCSPTEASVAPPCYTPHDHHTVAGPRPAQYAEPPRNVGTQYEEPRSGDFAEKNSGESTSPSGAAQRQRNGIYTVLRAAQYADCPQDTWRSSSPESSAAALGNEPRTAHYAEPRTVRYLERDLTAAEPRAAEYAETSVLRDETRVVECAEPEAENDGARVFEYEVLEQQVEEYEVVVENEPKSVEYEGEDERTKYAELQNMGNVVRERSAADTEAAHELLSLAAGVPPLPPATVLTVLSAPEPVLPVYTYALQPTSIYIIADEPSTNNLYATTVQTLTPLQQVEYSAQPQVSTYIIQEPIGAQPSLQYQPIYGGAGEPGSGEAGGVPVSVIETAPAAASVAEPAPLPLSVQVPVIEPVPQATQTLESTYETDSDENAPLCNNNKKNKYNCNECGKRYATSSNLSRHKQTHRSLDSKAAKRCGECGKAYVSMPALAMHVLTHRMGYVCGVCGKQFSRPWLLRGHLRSHTGEKPYNCPSCSKSFADRSNLRAHLQTHAADKRWECTRCNKTFALKSYLNKHQEAACSQDEEAH